MEWRRDGEDTSRQEVGKEEEKKRKGRELLREKEEWMKKRMRGQEGQWKGREEMVEEGRRVREEKTAKKEPEKVNQKGLQGRGGPFQMALVMGTSRKTGQVCEDSFQKGHDRGPLARSQKALQHFPNRVKPAHLHDPLILSPP